MLRQICLALGTALATCIGAALCGGLSFAMYDDAKIELCPGTDMELHLPLSADFAAGNLSPDDIDEQIHTTEVKS